MRRLIHIPILHSAADLGSLAGPVRDHYVRALGPTAWTERQQTIVELWTHIRTQIESLRLDYSRTQVYQDGLPVCGFERRIVEELAKAGSANHQLVLDLLARGATLMGTEDPQLLVEEYELHRRHADDPAANPVGHLRLEQTQRLLAVRDRFISERIDQTLQPDETGLLFLGAAHRLEMPPGSDIRLETLS